MREKKACISCYIPDELYTKMVNTGRNITDIVISGIQSQLEPNIEAIGSAPIGTDPNLLSAKNDLIEALQNQINDLKAQVSSEDEKQLLRINDLKEEITVLRKQLDIKDDTIKNLTTITESQLKGYKLIEAPGAKRSFLSRLKFW
jgi:hypothetical protein